MKNQKVAFVASRKGLIYYFLGIRNTTNISVFKLKIIYLEYIPLSAFIMSCKNSFFSSFFLKKNLQKKWYFLTPN